MRDFCCQLNEHQLTWVQMKWAHKRRGGGAHAKKAQMPPQRTVRGILPHTHIQTGSVCGFLLFYLCVFPRVRSHFYVYLPVPLFIFLPPFKVTYGSQLVTLAPIKIPAILRWSIIRAEANRGTWWHTGHSLHLLLSSPSSRGQKGKKTNMLCFLSLFPCLHNSLACYVLPLQCV